MKKKILTLLVAICAIFSSISGTSIQAFAEDGIMPCSGVETVPYGTTLDVLRDDSDHSITITNSNTTPYKYVSSDTRTHRLIYKIKASCPDGVGTIKISVIRQNHDTVKGEWKIITSKSETTITNNPNDSAYDGKDVTVSPGEWVQIKMETNSGGSAKITTFELYCD